MHYHSGKSKRKFHVFKHAFPFQIIKINKKWIFMHFNMHSSKEKKIEFHAFFKNNKTTKNQILCIHICTFQKEQNKKKSNLGKVSCI